MIEKMKSSTQSTTYSLETITQILNFYGGFNNFINGVTAGILCRLDNVDFLLYRNDTGVKLYYPAPYNPAIDYSRVEAFFSACRPILTKMVCDAADERLTSKE